MTFPPPVYQTFDVKSEPGNVRPRLKALRAAIAEAGLDGFLVPLADAHRGESVPDSEARLAWVTGFTGSAGIAVIGMSKAALFVDSRYTLQAPAQTDTENSMILPAAKPATAMARTSSRSTGSAWLSSAGSMT